jgi:hypothetical protein
MIGCWKQIEFLSMHELKQEKSLSKNSYFPMSLSQIGLNPL